MEGPQIVFSKQNDRLATQAQSNEPLIWRKNDFVHIEAPLWVAVSMNITVIFYIIFHTVYRENHPYVKAVNELVDLVAQRFL
jgi:hypothetical protein